MKLEEIAAQDVTVRVYGVVVKGLLFDEGSPYSGLTPVLLKGWGWKEVCVAVRERRILFLDGTGAVPESCGWKAPVKMWEADTSRLTLALDVTTGSLGSLITAHQQAFSEKVAEGHIGSRENGLDLDPEVAKRFGEFLSEDSLFNSTAWVAHNANNAL